MLTRIYLGFVLLIALPACAQVEPSATGPPPPSEDAMRTPPPVSGRAYPSATGSETRSNELLAGLNFQTAYDDNVLGLGSTSPVAEFSYSIRPTIALDQMTPRLHQTFTYSPGFTLYQRTSARNEADQNASANFQYRLSPHAALSVSDTFQKSTNVFNQPDAGVSGSTQSLTEAVVAPFADQLGNTASAEASYQFSANGMIGAGGASSFVNYLNPSQASGLSNSNTRGGSGFYNLRLSNTQYIGAIYQYSRMAADSVKSDSETQTNSIYFFYTRYLEDALSISVSAGPQHFDVALSSMPAYGSWTPAVTASVGWQKSRANFAASFSRTVTGAGGLFGAFQSNSASASARWQLARTWTVGLTTTYASLENATPLLPASIPGGHTIAGTASVQHSIGERFTAELGYARLDQSYHGVTALSADPDNDRAYISVFYQLKRPLGR
jgi:hypothetical protein